MLDSALLSSIATQLMADREIEIEGRRIPVRRIGRHRLRTAAFTMEGHRFQAIEQNPEKPSRWGQLARSGHQVVQFKDVEANKFVAVAVDGKVIEYGEHIGKRPER